MPLPVRNQGLPSNVLCGCSFQLSALFSFFSLKALHCWFRCDTEYVIIIVIAVTGIYVIVIIKVIIMVIILFKRDICRFNR